MAKFNENPESAIVNLLMEYGCQETGTEFDIGFECGKNGIINVNKGMLWINKISTEMRKFCRANTTQSKIRDVPNPVRESYYITYLKKKPYYHIIENHIRFDYRKAGSDYVGISLSLGADQLVRVLKYELQ